MRSGAHTAATNLVRAGLALVLTTLLARRLGPEGKGSYDLYLASSTLLGTFLGFSLQSGVTYVVARGHVDVRLLRRRLGWLALAQAGLALALLFALDALGWSRALLPAASSREVALAVACTVGLSAAATLWRAILIGSQRFILANHLDLLRQLVLFAFIAVALAIPWANALARVPAVIVAATLGAAFTLPIFMVRLADGGSHSDGLRQIFAYATPSYFANSAQFLNYRLDAFLVNGLLGPAALGLYQLPVTLCESLRLLPAAVAAITLPSVAAGQATPERNARRTAQMSRLVLCVGTVCAVALAVLAPWLLPWIFTAPFRASVPALLWLLPGIVALGFASVLSSHLGGMGRPGVNLIISLVGLAITVPLDLVLIPRLGIRGAAIASSASYGASAILTVLVFRRVTRVPLSTILLVDSGDWATIRRAAFHDS